MSLKKFLIFLIAAVMLTNAACGIKPEKKVVSEQDFTSAVEELGFQVNDDTETYSQTVGITKSLYGVTDDRSESYEFYVFKTKEDAEIQFDSLHIQIGDTEAEDKIQTDISGINYSLYKAEVDDLYYHVCRVENTLFFGSSVKEKKDAIEKFAKTIGYN